METQQVETDLVMKYELSIWQKIHKAKGFAGLVSEASSYFPKSSLVVSRLEYFIDNDQIRIFLIDDQHRCWMIKYGFYSMDEDGCETYSQYANQKIELQFDKRGNVRRAYNLKATQKSQV